MLIAIISIIILLLALAGMISATETAITATSPGRVQQLISEGNKRAKLLKELLKIKDKIISTLLIGNSIANTVCTTLAASVFIEILGDDIGTIASSIVMSFMIIVFSEVVPKAIAVAKAESLSMMAAPLIKIFLKILSPINWLLIKIVKLVCFIFRIDLNPQISGADEVRGVIEHQLIEGNVVKDDRDMLGGILDIRNLVTSDIMTHRSKIISIDIAQKAEDIVKFAMSSVHTRIPVWKDTADNIIGVLHVRDLLKHITNARRKNIENDSKDKASAGVAVDSSDIEKLLTEPLFVSENASLVNQLQEFREGKTHIAFVVDEYGDLQGIITLEDILEEIVGQIYDEHDVTKSKIVKISDTEYTVDGSITIRDLNREFDWGIPEGEANTIAGFIIQEMQRIPSKGEHIEFENLKLVVKTKAANRIKTVKVFYQGAQQGPQTQGSK